MKDDVRNQHLKRVMLSVIRNDPEVGLADLLDAFYVDQIIPGENIDAIPDELGDASVNEYRLAMIDGARHALAPSRDDGEVSGAGIGDAKQVQVGLVYRDVADYFHIVIW